MSCQSIKLYVVRGTNFQTSISFTEAWVELVETPENYEAVLTFREYQDDDAPVYLSLTSDIAAIEPDVPAAALFEATPSQTSLLPNWDIVAYCELRQKTGADVNRLYNADVEVSE